MRFFLTALFLGCALAGAGCRPADPLDWKVSAKSPKDYNRWVDATLAKANPKLQAEFSRAFTVIAGRSPNRTLVRHMDEEHNAVCQRIHRRTIRAVILDGYAIEKQSVLERIAVQTDMLLKNANRAGSPQQTAKTEARFARVIESQTATVEALNRRIGEIDDRVKQFSATAAK